MATSVQGTRGVGSAPQRTAAPAPAVQDPKAAKTRQDLQAIISQRGVADPIAQQAQQLIQAIDTDPNVVNDGTYQEALTRIGRAVSQASAGGNPAALAKDAAPTVSNAVAKVQANQSAAKQTSLVNQIQGVAQGGVKDNTAFFNDNVAGLLPQQRAAAGLANYADQEAIVQQTQARDAAKAREQGLVSEQRTNAANYNQQGNDLYNNYASGQQALNTQDQGTLSSYLNATNPLMTQLQARGSNPQDIAQQQAALQAAIGMSGGSLDYQAAQAALSQAALSQYGSNPADIQRQQNSYDKFGDIGNGALDYQSQAARAFADPNDVANQRKSLGDIQEDLRSGGKEQQASLDLIKSRTGNTATAEEAFLAEVARRKFENDDRSSREAQMADLSQRGLRSGSAEIAGQLSEHEQLSQDRTLAELGLQAQAMQRAQAYTGMQADQSNAMRSSQQNSLGMQGNLASALRNASFDEAYKRGVGSDTASANNQGTQLAGYQLQGNEANVMRQQADTVGMFNTGEANQNSMFNAGQANQTSQFNAGQTNNAYANNQATRAQGVGIQATQSNAIRSANDAMSQYQDTYAQNEATRVGNLAGQRAQTGLNTTNQVGTRNASTYQSGAAMLDTNYGRDANSIALDMGTVQPQYARDSDVAGMTGAAGERAFQRVGTQIGSAGGAAGVRSATIDPANTALINAIRLGVGSDKNIQDENALLAGR